MKLELEVKNDSDKSPATLTLKREGAFIWITTHVGQGNRQAELTVVISRETLGCAVRAL